MTRRSFSPNKKQIEQSDTMPSEIPPAVRVARGYMRSALTNRRLATCGSNFTHPGSNVTDARSFTPT